MSKKEAPTTCLDLPYRFKAEAKPKMPLREKVLTKRELWDELTDSEKRLCEFFRGYIKSVKIYEVIE